VMPVRRRYMRGQSKAPYVGVPGGKEIVRGAPIPREVLDEIKKQVSDVPVVPLEIPQITVGRRGRPPAMPEPAVVEPVEEIPEPMIPLAELPEPLTPERIDEPAPLPALPPAPRITPFFTMGRFRVGFVNPTRDLAASQHYFGTRDIETSGLLRGPVTTERPIPRFPAIRDCDVDCRLACVRDLFTFGDDVMRMILERKKAKKEKKLSEADRATVDSLIDKYATKVYKKGYYPNNVCDWEESFTKEAIREIIEDSLVPAIERGSLGVTATMWFTTLDDTDPEHWHYFICVLIIEFIPSKSAAKVAANSDFYPTVEEGDAENAFHWGTADHEAIHQALRLLAAYVFCCRVNQPNFPCDKEKIEALWGEIKKSVKDSKASGREEEYESANRNDRTFRELTDDAEEGLETVQKDFKDNYLEFCKSGNEGEKEANDFIQEHLSTKAKLFEWIEKQCHIRNCRGVRHEDDCAKIRPKKSKVTNKKAMSQAIPRGHGRLVAVTPIGSSDVVMWFEDPIGIVRATRVSCGKGKGLTLEIQGQAELARA